jgi:hypothetical protein
MQSQERRITCVTLTSRHLCSQTARYRHHITVLFLSTSWSYARCYEGGWTNPAGGPVVANCLRNDTVRQNTDSTAVPPYL